MVYQPDVQDKVEQVSWGSFLPALITLGSAQGLSAWEHHGQFLISPASRAPPALSGTGTRLPSVAGAQALERLQEMEKLRTKESLTTRVWGNCWTTGMLPGGFEASAPKAALLGWQKQNQNSVSEGFLHENPLTNPSSICLPTALFLS